MAEIVVLLAGVIARYVFHQPLIWSDELASILFLWLAMLGAVVAFRRGEHMRMTALVGMARPAVRAFLDVVAIAAAARLPAARSSSPAFEFADEEAFVTTPALEIPNAWRAAALPVGIGADDRRSAVLRLAQVGELAAGARRAGAWSVADRRAASLLQPGAARRSATSTC